MKTKIQAFDHNGFAFFDRMAVGIDVLAAKYDEACCFGMFDRVIVRARFALAGVSSEAVRPILGVADAIICSWAESGGKVRHNGVEQPFNAELAKFVNPLDLLGLIAESLRRVPVTLLAAENRLTAETEVTLERVSACLALTRAFEGLRLMETDDRHAAAFCLMTASNAVGLIEPVNNVAVGTLSDEIIARIRARTSALGGLKKAANAATKPPNPERLAALELKAKRPKLSADQIKTRLSLKASPRTIRGWLAAC